MIVFNLYLIFLDAFYLVHVVYSYLILLYAFCVFFVSCAFNLHQFLSYANYEYILLSSCKFSFFWDSNTNPKEDQVVHFRFIIHRIISLYLFVFSLPLECSLTVIQFITELYLYLFSLALEGTVIQSINELFLNNSLT